MKTCYIVYNDGTLDTIADKNAAELDFNLLNAKHGGISNIEFRYDGKCIGMVYFGFQAV